MKICVISHDYPDKNRSVFTFVAQLIEEIARLGHECYVIAPYSVTKNRGFSKNKEIKIVGAGSVTIIRPNYISMSTLKIGSFSFSDFFYSRAIERSLKKLLPNVDCVYGHFWNSALHAYHQAKRHNIPLFVATGESTIPQNVIDTKFNDFYNYVSGVICVSSKNKEESIRAGLTVAEKCIVLPNSINPLIFHKRDRANCRLKLGISNDKFIVAFVGWFDERKGAIRVSQAINQIQDGNIYSFFIGSGELEPVCENILFKGRLSHNEIATYLNAADVFVLPTLREGCCNAIVEAMACGLPIVSSDLSFNHDILNKDNSIMVDPYDIDEIASAINSMYCDKLRRAELSAHSLTEAKKYTIENRAKQIINYIKSKM